MNLPEQPPPFRPPDGTRPWSWRLESAGGGAVDVGPEWSQARFPTQADAESWVGEVWPELLERGVDSVTLLDGDREVYGPMSLRA